MSKIALKTSATGTGTIELEAPVTNADRTLALPDAAGEIAAVEVVSSSTDNTVTHKLKVNVGGVAYYLLAADTDN